MHGSTLYEVAPENTFAARAVREVGKLFAGSETWLALIDADGTIVSGSGGAREHARLEQLFGAATVAHVRAFLSRARPGAAEDVHVVDGRTIDDEAIELRLVRADTDDDSCLALVRPLAEAAVDHARGRVRQLSAALQAVADIVVTLEELQGHEEARRRAALVAPLTERERRVALAVADGVRTSQIANDLFVSQSTVRNYLPGIYRKLGVRTRGDLVELLNSPD